MTQAEHNGSAIPRVRVGAIQVDALRFDEALKEIGRLVETGEGGSVFTPNVDHVVLAEHDLAFRKAYEGASLRLADGMPLLWVSRLSGTSIPEKVSGSDLVVPLMALAALCQWRVFLLGGSPGVAEAAAKVLKGRFPVNIVGWDSSVLSIEPGDPASVRVVAKISAAHPHLVLVALGAPKQEIWIARHSAALRPAVAVGVGASLDFVAGMAQRAPSWVSRSGFEWLYRLAHEPGRLWRRYLVRDPEFLGIAARSLLRAARARKAARRRANGEPNGPPMRHDVPDPYTTFRHTERFPTLDGLRAISIVAVIWHHAAGHTSGLLSRGNLGVELFFAISGFLITTLLLREAEAHGQVSLTHFYQRRALRIFPLYYAVLLLYTVLVLGFDARTAAGTQFFGHLPYFLTYTSNWFVDRHSGPRVIFYFAWSLATEEQFYFVWPWVIRFARRRSLPIVFALGAVTLHLLVASGVRTGVLDGSWLPLRIASSIALPICLGCVFACLLHDQKAFGIVYRWLGSPWSAPAAALTVTLLVLVDGVPNELIETAMAVLVATCCIRPDHGLGHALEGRAFVYVGTISYGMYLLHMLGINAVRRLTPFGDGVSAFAGALFLTVVLATVSYYGFERPFLRLKDRLNGADRRTATPAPATAAA